MFLRDDGKYKITWKFVAGKFRGVNEYRYNKLIFSISDDGNDLLCEFCGKRKSENFVARLKGFKHKTAIQAIGKHRDWGRHFEEGVKQVYHDLGLPLGYVERVLREVR